MRRTGRPLYRPLFPQRRRNLAAAAERAFGDTFASRVLPFDGAAAPYLVNCRFRRCQSAG